MCCISFISAWVVDSVLSLGFTIKPDIICLSQITLCLYWLTLLFPRLFSALCWFVAWVYIHNTLFHSHCCCYSLLWLFIIVSVWCVGGGRWRLCTVSELWEVFAAKELVQMIAVISFSKTFQSPKGIHYLPKPSDMVFIVLCGLKWICGGGSPLVVCCCAEFKGKN